MSSGFNELISLIRSKAVLLEEQYDDPRVELGVLFMRAIQKTVREINEGANSEDFSDLTVINLIIMGANEGYEADEMRSFINKLKTDDPQ